jgi:hypothetical protein
MKDSDLALRLEEMAAQRSQWDKDHRQRDKHWKVLVYVATLSLVATTALGIWGPR